MVSELEQEEIRPITPDREALEVISRTVQDRAQHVQDVQKELLEAQHTQDLIDEQEHYAEVCGEEDERRERNFKRPGESYLAYVTTRIE